MATNPGNAEQPNTGVHNPSGVVISTGPGLENQHVNNSSLGNLSPGNAIPGNQSQSEQELRNEMSIMRAQMQEMIRMVMSLRHGTDYQHAQWPPLGGLPLGFTPPSNPENNQGAGPSVIVGNGQPIPAGSDEASAEPRVQTPSPIVIPQVASQGFNSQLATNPQSQGPALGNSVYLQHPNTAPSAAQVINPYQGTGVYSQGYSAEQQQTRDKFQLLEERLKLIEGSGSRAREARDLCLIPDVVIPPKFKVPDFDKYRGVTCPKSHLTMYCRKMAAFSHDDKLLIHYFQDSLAGASLNWYMQLEPSHIHSWKDLADAFIRQYQYNSDMAPDRTQLQGMSKRDNESFKEYAQRWRALAAQVSPPLLEKELVFMFMETLPPLYYDRLIGSVSSNFSDMVVIGERLENGMRSGKIASSSAVASSSKKPFSGFPKKKEGESNNITINPPYAPQTIPIPSQKPQNYPPQNQQNNQYRNTNYRNYPERKPVNFDPIPMSYTDLFNYLLSNKLISTRSMKPIYPPYPKGYNPNATCGFHSGAVGHSVEDCKAFKYVVQDLIDAKGIVFKQENPSITTNPLPEHGKPSTNAVYEGQALVRTVDCIQTPLEVVHAELCKFGVIKEGCEDRACAVENCKGVCNAFKLILQDLMDRHIIQIGVQEREEDVLTYQSDRNRGIQGPIEVPYNASSKPAEAKPTVIVVKVPSPFPYQKDNAVPWNYNVQIQAQNTPIEPDVTNIAGPSGVTRSGRVFAPEFPKTIQSKEDEERARKGKGKETETTEVRKVSSPEAHEFLKIMRQSDYKVVDQLNQTPAKISIMNLLLNSEAHRTALVKVLSDAHVAQDTTVNQLDGIVGGIVAANHIAFTDDELTPEGRNHNQALHISVKCGDYTLSRVLIDNGSSLNVMPKSTMSKLDVDCSYMKPSSTLVRAFDGSKKEVLGEMEFPIQIGPEVFYINFQIMDIASSYSCLLGRPWIHAAGAVPSSLHQRLKFVVADHIVVVFGEEEFLITKPPPSGYIEAAEESLETAFQSLEIADDAFAGEVSSATVPKMSNADLMVAKIMISNGYQFGKGLGKSNQGILTPIRLRENKDRFGLGYWPTLADRKRIADEKRELKLAKAQGREPSLGRIPICDISQSFKSAGIMDPSQVAAIEDEAVVENGGRNLVRRSAGEKLDNWKIMDFPVVSIKK